MKLKLRVAATLILLAASCLFITLKLISGLEDDGAPNMDRTFTDEPFVHRTLYQVPSSNPLSPGDHSNKSQPNPWEVWSSWVKPSVLYPIDSFHSFNMNIVLSALSSYPITKFDVGYRGTQLKATMLLSGDQRTVFKPKRFSRNEIVDGPSNPYAGYDRHNGEIASFHLDGILGFGLAPPVAGRKINLTKLISVTEKKLFETYVQKDGNICFYGKCYYCKPSDLACAEGSIMEGSVTIWIPSSIKLKTWRHPYQRTYIAGRKAKWEISESYCQELLISESKYYHLLPDIMDTSVFDYLIGNADRHHFETFANLDIHGRLLHIDSGKSFGNPIHDEKSILAPLKQCCRLRNSTWSVLQTVSKGPLSKILDESMRRDKLYPILTPEHLQAIDRRLEEILRTIEKCIKTHGQKIVLFDVWK